jgi:outer membrane autotransporter protein
LRFLLTVLASECVAAQAPSGRVDRFRRISHFHRVVGARFGLWFPLAIFLLCMALVGDPQRARAQCTVPPFSNGGVVQNGPPPCTVGNVSVGFGTAITATNGADVTANGSVTAQGFGTGVSATTNSLVTVNGPVTADGLGLSASSGATIIANGITLGNTGGGAVAMMANNGTIIANGITVTWPNGGGQSLVQALNGGLIQFTPNSSISIPTGGVPAALLADGANSRIIADGLSVSMGNSGGMAAARAQAGGNIQLTGGSEIAFSGGGGNTGLLATGTNSTITTTGVTILVGNGGNDVGASAASGGQVALAGGSVSVQGGGGETGLRATGTGSTITATDVTVSVTGSGGDAGLNVASGGAVATTGGSVSVGNGAGGLLQNGGNITMAGTNVTASGSGGFGFLFNNGGAANTLQYSNGTVTASEASFSIQGATATIGLANTTTIANNNTLLETRSSGSTLFNAQGSTLRGVIATETGSTSTVNLTQNTVWRMTGSSTATNLANDSSRILYTPPSGDPTLLSSYKTLTVNNYTGAGGLIGLNTFLGTDSSPSDKLIINGGNASGGSLLRITNTTGPGAYTTANGILVVEAINNGTTQAGSFTLAGEARGGAIDYFLFRGGLNGSAPDNWFLRSSFNGGNGGDGNGNGDGGNGPITPPGVLPPEALPEELPPVLPPGVYPIIGPEIATYGVVQPIARQLGLATLGTLHERIGDTLAIANAGHNGGWARSGWARGFGEQINNRYRAFADPRTDGHLAGFQSGIDLMRGEWLPGHRDVAGVYFAYANANVDVTGLVTNEAATNYVLRKTGSLNLNGWSGGAYWTHYGPRGWYLDAVLQATAYEGTASTIFARLPTDGVGFVSSLEAGYPIPVPALGPGFVLEPQGQIVWQHVSFGDANDGLGDVALGSTSGASGRLGLRGRWTVVSDGGHVWQPYVRANLWRDWGAQATTTFSEVDRVPLLEQATRLDLAGGVTAKINAGLSLYAQAGYQFAVGDTDGHKRDGVRGDLGLRYAW